MNFDLSSVNKSLLRGETCSYRYMILLFSLVVAIVFSVSSVSFPPSNYGQSIYQSFYSLSPLLIGLAISVFLFKGGPFFTTSFYVSFTMALLVVAVTWATMTQWGHIFSTGTFYVFLGLLVLAIAAAIVLQIVRFTTSFRITDDATWENFFLQLLLFIPCLFEDMAAYLVQQFKMTSSPLLVLFFMEILVLVLLFTLPSLIQYFANLDRKVLLAGAVPLGTATTLADSSVFESTIIKDKTIQKSYNQNYCMSMWIYLNRYDTTLQEHEWQIFNYGSQPLNGNPCVYVQSGQVYVSLSNTNRQQTRLPIDLPSQKWNHLVFNYRFHQIDVFVNGSLIDTITLHGENFPTHSNKDLVIVGDNRGGIFGSICNITYAPQPATKMQIATEYNLLRFFNPPIVPGSQSSNQTKKNNFATTPPLSFPASLFSSISTNWKSLFPAFVPSNHSPRPEANPSLTSNT